MKGRAFSQQGLIAVYKSEYIEALCHHWKSHSSCQPSTVALENIKTVYNSIITKKLNGDGMDAQTLQFLSLLQDWERQDVEHIQSLKPDVMGHVSFVKGNVDYLTVIGLCFIESLEGLSTGGNLFKYSSTRRTTVENSNFGSSVFI
jgi:uncharacterized protein YcbK (DUF882 family)